MSDYPNLAEHGVVFNGLRFSILTTIGRVRDERIRTAASDLYYLGRDMVLLRPQSLQGKIYGGDDPVLIQDRRLPQFIRMVGKVLKGESIDDEKFPAITVAHGDGYLVQGDWTAGDG